MSRIYLILSIQIIRKYVYVILKILEVKKRYSIVVPFRLIFTINSNSRQKKRGIRGSNSLWAVGILLPPEYLETKIHFLFKEQNGILLKEVNLILQYYNGTLICKRQILNKYETILLSFTESENKLPNNSQLLT